MIKKDIYGYNHDKIFIIKENYKTVDTKAYNKVRKIINYKKFKNKPLCYFALIIGLVLGLLPIILVFILTTLINNLYLNFITVIVIIMLLILEKRIRIITKYYDCINSIVNKIGGYEKINKYEIFINVFVKRKQISITEEELLSDYLLIRKLEKQDEIKNENIKNTLITIITIIIEYEFNPIFDVIKSINNSVLTIVYLVIYVCCCNF